MKRILKKIFDFIVRDVIRENELKDTAVLLRISLLYSAIYYFALCLVSIYSLPSFIPFPAIILLIVIGLFIATYHDKTTICLYTFCVITVLSMSVFSFLFGSTLSFQYIIFFTISIIFYRTEGRLLIKYLTAISISILICGTTVYIGLQAQPIYHISLIYYLHILVLNMVYFTSTSITIARFYCMKFSHSEEKIMQYSRKLETLASMDALTNLYNRRHMNKHLEELEHNYFNANQPFSIAIADIDFFKKINDTYGHDAGDFVLSEISLLFHNFMKNKGQVARWGGEEFLFSFEGDNADYVFVELNTLRTLIRAHTFIYKENLIQVTVTFGLEEYDSGIGLENTITRADAKLYTGKVEGRDRVIY